MLCVPLGAYSATMIGVPVRSQTYGPYKPKSLNLPDGKSGDSTPAMIAIVLTVEDAP